MEKITKYSVYACRNHLYLKCQQMKLQQTINITYNRNATVNNKFKYVVKDRKNIKFISYNTQWIVAFSMKFDEMNAIKCVGADMDDDDNCLPK